MKRLLVLLAFVIASLALPMDPASAGCQWVTSSHVIDGHAQAQTIQVCSPTGGGGAEEVSDADGPIPPTNSGLDAICVATAISLGQDPFRFCDEPADGTQAVVTPGIVAVALTRIPLPPAVLVIQPPNGRTLVNFETNFYTETQPFDRTVMLLGQRVDLHIVPSGFGWRFGDGGSLATAGPGSPYPHLDVTHRYLTKGHVAPSVDTTYTATFRVNGGPWRDVPGSVTIPGAPVELDVVTATPTLVGYDS
jgi:hypothetical protein